MMNLEQLLMKEQGGVLLDIQLELLNLRVPATGKAHEYVRKVNRMIDAGNLCINPTTYRKVYLPTLAKAAQREMARRYIEHLLYTRAGEASLEETTGFVGKEGIKWTPSSVASAAK